MGKSINGRPIRGMDRFQAIEAGLELQARFGLLIDIIRGLRHPEDRAAYENAKSLADDLLGAIETQSD